MIWHIGAYEYYRSNCLCNACLYYYKSQSACQITVQVRLFRMQCSHNVAEMLCHCITLQQLKSVDSQKSCHNVVNNVTLLRCDNVDTCTLFG